MTKCGIINKIFAKIIDRKLNNSEFRSNLKYLNIQNSDTNINAIDVNEYNMLGGKPNSNTKAPLTELNIITIEARKFATFMFNLSIIFLGFSTAY